MNLFDDDEYEFNPHQIAWMSKDWDSVQTLVDEYKESAVNQNFEILNELTLSKKKRNADLLEGYSKFWVDNALSQHSDCIGYVNVMNLYGSGLTDSMHYNYYLHALPEGKRYGKWASYKDDVKEMLVIKAISKKEIVSDDTARMYINIMKNKGTFDSYLKTVKGLINDDFLKSITKNAKEIKMLKEIVEEWKK